MAFEDQEEEEEEEELFWNSYGGSGYVRMIISFRQRVVIKRGPGFGFLKKLILTSMHYCPFEAVSVLDQYASIAYLS